MQDRSAHFYAVVGRLCDHAATGQLLVRLALEDGTVCEGRPSTRRPPEDRELDDTGYGEIVDFEHSTVRLADVVAASVVHPSRAEPPATPS